MDDAASCGTGETVVLPHGYWLDGRHCREVSLRSLTGRDEEFLVDRTGGAPPVARATELLARCVQQMAGRDRVSRDAVAELVAGDREALLWQLRRLTLGERVQATLECPSPACGKPMDLELSVGELLQEPYPDARAEYECEAEGLRCRFRLPTGFDLEAVCTDPDGDRATGRLLSRCVTGVFDGDVPVSEWSADRLGKVPQQMEVLDPQAELRLDVCCPECGERFPAILDAAAYLLNEIEAHADDLYLQVHTLAMHYHWSEAEILGLSPAKRRRYLGILADQMDEAAPL